jgi:enoyl-[acyl-carrier protein] reductase II
MEKGTDPSENLKIQIERIRGLTQRPFAINIPLDLDQSGIFIDLVLRERVKIVVTSAGNPESYTELLKGEGIKVLHVVSSVRQACKAEACGVDGVIVEGVEAGGRVGFDEIPLFSLVPQVVDALNIPVIAAGGIVDSRGVVAAFALGAEGVQLGTRFVAVRESIAHLNYKKAIIEAKDTDTVITCRRILPTRMLKTELSRRLLAMEERGARAEEIRNFLGFSRARRGQLEGDLEEGELFCGASVGLIREILPASAVIQRLIDGYDEVLRRIS